MNDFAIMVQYGTFGLFCLMVVTAAVFDIWKFIIPNSLSLGIIGLFFASVLLLGIPIEWGYHLGIAGAVFLVGLVVYKFGALGAGDVKLLTAVSLWPGRDYIIDYLIAVGLCGGGLALGLLLLRRLITGALVFQGASQPTTLPRVLLPDEAVPYGVGIALASVYFAFQSPLLGAYLF